MFLIATNILLCAANSDAREHTAARAQLEAWRHGSEAWMATWSICYEFLRVATHRAVLPRPLPLAQAWEFLLAVMAAPSFRLLEHTERHRDIVGDLAMRYPGVREIRTADTDFRQFDFLHVVNPLQAPA